MPLSLAIWRIQRSERMLIGGASKREDGPAQPLVLPVFPGFSLPALTRACALRRLRFSRKAAASRSARASFCGTGLEGAVISREDTPLAGALRTSDECFANLPG